MKATIRSERNTARRRTVSSTAVGVDGSGSFVAFGSVSHPKSSQMTSTTAIAHTIHQIAFGDLRWISMSAIALPPFCANVGPAFGHAPTTRGDLRQRFRDIVNAPQSCRSVERRSIHERRAGLVAGEERPCRRTCTTSWSPHSVADCARNRAPHITLCRAK
jgi:hypothetical protein